MLNVAKSFQDLIIWQKAHTFVLGVYTASHVQQKANFDRATKLFNKITNSEVKYHDADNYQKMLEIMEIL